MRKSSCLGPILALLLALAPFAAPATDRAGQFDYYVLALSWSPSFCALEGEAKDSEQCRKGAGHGWVLHGLWPQYETGGWPEYCNTTERDPSRAQTASLADIMGTSGAAWYQWKKHGRCSGLTAGTYLGALRLAYRSVIKPEVFQQLDRDVKLPAKVIEEAFLKANPALSPDMVTVTCKARRVHEVRVCLTKRLDPRPCGADMRRDCTLSDALLSPIK